MQEIRSNKRIQRHRRIRAKISGSAIRPRLFVFRSNKHVYVQLIDDEQGKTIASVSDFGIKKKARGAELMTEIAKQIVEKAKEKKIERVVFDRGGYRYHGNVKVLADQIREQGLVF